MFEQSKFPHLIWCIPIIGWQGHIYRSLNNNSRTRGRFLWCRHGECSQVSGDSFEELGCWYQNGYNSWTCYTNWLQTHFQGCSGLFCLKCEPWTTLCNVFLSLCSHNIFLRVSAILWCTGNDVRVMMMSWHDTDGIVALQKWEIMWYSYSEASNIKRYSLVLHECSFIHL